MKLAGLVIGILLAAGPSWAADLKATLKKAEAGEAASQYQLAERLAYGWPLRIRWWRFWRASWCFRQYLPLEWIRAQDRV